MAAPVIPLSPVIREVIEEVMDKKRMREGIDACITRSGDFGSVTEMRLAGIAMVPEARQLMSDRLTAYWDGRRFPVDIVGDYDTREILVGAGFHTAAYCASRVAMGFPKPVVLERGTPEQVGGAFAVSLKPVFRLNSRNRPGTVGLPDQDKALNYLPGGLLQPSMVTSEEYPTNADMAWLIRLTLMQYANVYPGVTVTDIGGGRGDYGARLSTSSGNVAVGRVLDARGTGDEKDSEAGSERMLTFSQLMTRMGTMFPLRGMRQVAVIGSGDSAKCAVESLLGIAPGNSSAIGLDYTDRVDWYTGGQIDGRTCSEFRDNQRGRYIRIAQYLEGNISNPSTRLRVMSTKGYPVPLPDGVIVNERTYDLAVTCTGSERPSLNDSAGFSYFKVQRRQGQGTILAQQAAPVQAYRIGPAAGIEFSEAETAAGVGEIPANRVAMFRLAPRTAALAAMLPGVTGAEEK
jgi:hypothetical protein